ncbi:MAG: hypothetical protein D6761_08425 [Candidatus Dadabacteria bacterium]|nr:MAG: hypothetical protein D6761_08425 [Candidatus Dadabacteria bacterium]
MFRIHGFARAVALWCIVAACCACSGKKKIDLPETQAEAAAALGLPYSFWDENSKCPPAEIQCVTDDDCKGDAQCKVGQCVPVESLSDYKPADNVSTLAELKLPADTGEPCCHDVDGDGEMDNNLDALLTAIQTTVAPDRFNSAFEATPSDVLQDSIDSGFGLPAFEFREKPADGCGAVKISAWPALLDMDRDGEVSAEEAAQNEVQLQRTGAGAAGAANQMNRAAIEDGMLRVEGGSFELGLEIDQVTKLRLNLVNVRMEVPVASDSDGVESRPSVGFAPQQSSLSSIPSGMMSAVIPLPPVVEQLNELAKDCTCAGIDPERDVMTWSVEDRVTAKCVQDFPERTPDCDSDNVGMVCAFLTEICAALPVMTTFADAASTPDGAIDSVSVGSRILLKQARLAADPFGPTFYSIDDAYTLTQSWDADPSQIKPYVLPVLENDYAEPLESRKIADFVQAQHGTVARHPNGKALLYTPESGAFTDLFTYVFSNGVSEETTNVKITMVENANTPDDDAEPLCPDGRAFEITVDGKWKSVEDKLAADGYYNGSPDVVELRLCKGTYAFQIGGGPTTAAWPVVVNGQGPDQTIIDASSFANGILANGTTYQVSNVTISKAQQSAVQMSADPNVTVELSNCILDTLTGPDAQALVFAQGGTIDINNCLLRGGADGGGIVATGASVLTLRNSTVTGNHGISGAGIKSTNNLTIENSAIDNNTATSEGGGLNIGGTATIRNSVISNNTAPRGGGIEVDAAGAQITIVDTQFTDNAPDQVGSAGTSFVLDSSFYNGTCSQTGCVAN